MLKVSSFSRIHLQFLTLIDLTDSSINDVVINMAPFLIKAFFHMVDVTDPAVVNSLLQNARDRVNSVIILFIPYPFQLSVL